MVQKNSEDAVDLLRGIFGWASFSDKYQKAEAPYSHTSPHTVSIMLRYTCISACVRVSV